MDKPFFHRIEDAISEHGVSVLATIISATRSTPRKPGTMALMAGGKLLAGTIGGGLAELTILKQSVEVEATCRPRQVRVNLSGDIVTEEAICGGELLLLLQPLTEENINPIKAITRSLTQRETGILVTHADFSRQNEEKVTLQWFSSENLKEALEIIPVIRNEIFDMLLKRIRDDFKLIAEVEVEEVTLITDDDNSFRVLPGDSDQEFETGNSENVNLNKGDSLRSEVEVFTTLATILPPPSLFIAGAGHIGKALTPLGKMLGFEVSIWDYRPEFASREQLPMADHILTGTAGEAMNLLRPDRDTWIVIVTHGHRDDGAILKECIGSDAAYIGMIGSKAKVAQMRDHFFTQGWATPAQWRRIYSPIGADIGASSVEEIAIAIAAQIIEVRHRSAARRI